MTRAELLVHKDALQEDRHLRMGHGPYIVLLIDGHELPGWSFGGQVFTRAGWVDEALVALERPPEEWELWKVASEDRLNTTNVQDSDVGSTWQERFWRTFNAQLCIGLGLLPSKHGQLDYLGRLRDTWPAVGDAVTLWMQFSAFLESPEADKFRSLDGQRPMVGVCTQCGGESNPGDPSLCQLCRHAYVLERQVRWEVDS